MSDTPVPNLVKFYPAIMDEEQLETFIIHQPTQNIKPSLPVAQGQLIQHQQIAAFAHQPDFAATLNNQVIILQASNSCGLLEAGTGHGSNLGSAFFVSPTVLVTARHNVYVVDTNTKHEGPFTFTFNENPLGSVLPIQKILLEEIDPNETLREAAIAADPNKGADMDPRIPGTAIKRMIDFVFLRSPQLSNTFLLPQTQVGLPLPVTVVGYPAPSTMEEVRVFAPLLGAFGALFVHKHAAPGNLLANGRVVAHTCSTLKGCSGGPVLNPANGHFIAVHTSGADNQTHDHNLGFSADHPVFKILYKKIVFNTLDDNSKAAVAAYLVAVSDI